MSRPISRMRDSIVSWGSSTFTGTSLGAAIIATPPLTWERGRRYDRNPIPLQESELEEQRPFGGPGPLRGPGHHLRVPSIPGDDRPDHGARRRLAGRRAARRDGDGHQPRHRLQPQRVDERRRPLYPGPASARYI